MPDFTADEHGFALDGRPVRLLSGALHYFRVHDGLWAHRLRMLRAMGLNCVETYAPWNRHQRHRGRPELSELGRFLDAAQDAGLYAIVRPGPYICAEWENGGLPYWLPGRVRTSDPAYLAAVDGWLAAVAGQVVDRQADRGGPVVLLQVENEYGSYGSDRRYLSHLVRRWRELGVTVPLVTSDGPEDHMLSGGTVPGALATVNFGRGAREAFGVLRRHQPRGPLMCMEFWCGWFTHWGGEAAARAADEAAAVLRDILEQGASVNIYMAHGGTSFGGWAGANRSGEDHRGPLRPTLTSYDYDAPVDELGRPTPKFWAFREILTRFTGTPPPQPPPAPPPLAEPLAVRPSHHLPLSLVMDALGGLETSTPHPPSFEDLDIDRGLVRYRFHIPGPRPALPLYAAGVRDVAVAWVDGVRMPAALDEESPLIGEVPGPAEVELWVESLGRVNYGPRLAEAKGLTGGLLHELQYIHGVRARGLRLDALESPQALDSLPWRPAPGAHTSGAYRAPFALPSGAGDALLELPGWGRGFAWVNGFCLGRYWDRGPQRALYVPGPVLREAPRENTLLLLELDRPGEDAPRLVPPTSR
ncbi:glycoside hydrolase family 35 protein [Streptomyces orinoci]|uniref:Beta-galactosidase family protein n=1 Tax=Streptomyces orinoci TaxID=67339 RepID=A0ABV3JX67_STRON|nr:beta-galactosidase family protein [Streptomyces orinoci]